MAAGVYAVSLGVGLTAAEIIALIQERCGQAAILASDTAAAQPWVALHPEHLLAVCTLLRDDERLYFDLLECLSGVDLGVQAAQLMVVYHLHSIVHGHRLVLKCKTSRDILTQDDGTLLHPSIPSVMHIWRAAEWHEREAYDLVGIHFAGHSDLRRILLPEDWEGHPLRKDYQQQAYYHGIRVDYN